MASTFSYAQAAKGLAAPPVSSSQTSKASPEMSPNAAPKTSDTQSSKAPTADSDSVSGESTSMQNSQSTITADKDVSLQDLKASSPRVNGVSSPSSEDYGVSSTSTLVKDDDQSSAIHTSSESTWENKSQASVPAEIAAGDESEKPLEKGRSKSSSQPDVEKETPPAKPLHEAPPPMVNIWKKRAEQRAAAVPSPPTNSAPTKKDGNTASKSHSLPEANLVGAVKSLSTRERKSESGPGRNHSEPRSANPRRDNEDSLRAKRAQISRATSGDTNLPVNAPLPPNRDQESWPTPDTAIEETKKPIEKADKAEKAEEDGTEKKKAHGKNTWTHVPFTPTVVFTTPLPGSGRRGGRGGGRGGREDASRGSSNAVNGTSGSIEERKGAAHSLTNGDGPRRTRPETGVRSASPSKTKTEVPTPEPIPAADQVNAQASEPQPAKTDAGNGELASLPNGHQRRFSVDRVATINGTHHPRGGSTRGRGRRGDYAGNVTERRRDVENGSTSTEQQAAFGAPGAPSASQEGPDRRKKSISEESFSHLKQQAVDRRNGGFSSTANSRGRGESRGRGGARGRGAHHFQASQQMANQQYPGAQNSMMTQPYGYPSSTSPPGWSQGQNGPYYAPQPQPSRNYRGGNQRAQSIPLEGSYGQYGNPYNAMPPHMAPLQTHMGYPYDAQAGQSMSAAPYGPYAEQYNLFAAVATQLEYYFSMDNLIKDVYLRSHMDSQGFVYLSVIANFSRMKKLTTDLELIKYACANSRTIEWRVGNDGKDRLRPVKDWQQWVMPVEERDASARNDGPSDLALPNLPVPQGFDVYSMQMRHSLGGPIPQSAAAASAPWHQMNGGRMSHSQSPMSPSEVHYGQQVDLQAQHQTPNGYDAQSFSQGPPMTNGHTHHMDPEADTFTDAQAAGLMVVVGKADGASNNLPPLTNRTFSNGSIDGTELAEGAAAPERNDSGHIVNGDDSRRGRTGRSGAEHAPSASQDSTNSVDGTKLCWIKSDDRPVNMIPNREETERYPVLRAHALQERADAPVGICPHNMIVLYQFWSHFLLRNFNSTMYSEFRLFALQDYHERQTDVGYLNLLKYYQHALASSDRTIRDRVARHYVTLAQAELRNEDNGVEQIALKQFHAQWRDGPADALGRKKLSPYIDDDLRKVIEQPADVASKETVN